MKDKELEKINEKPDIYKDTIIRERFHSGFERTKDVKWLVIHGTAGGGTLDWMRKMDQSNDFRSTRYRSYKRGIGLFHYLIERDGTIINIIDPNKWVYHASVGKLDMGTIGVELLNPSRGNTTPYTEEQYRSLLDLYTYLREDIKTLDVMLSHRRCQEKVNLKRRKQCPGPGFNWRYWRDLVETEYDFTYAPGYESLWRIVPKKQK